MSDSSPVNDFFLLLGDLLPGWNKFVEKKKSGGLLREQTRRLFGIAYDYNEISASIDRIVNELRQDWAFFEMYAECVGVPIYEDIWDGNHRREIADVRCTVRKRAQSLGLHRKYLFKRPYELLDALRSLGAEMNRLKLDIRKVLEKSMECKARVMYPNRAFPGLDRFLEWNLVLLKEAGGDAVPQRELYFIHDELLLIRRYFDCVKPIFQNCSMGPLHSYLENAVMRIALQVCNLWFHRADKGTAELIASLLVDLHQEIDPANPYFLELNLILQEDIHKISYYRGAVDESALVAHFCSYLLSWHGEQDLREELISLVVHLNNNTLSDGEDFDAFFAEIKALLGEAAFLHRRLQRESSFLDPADDKRKLAVDLPFCSDLLAKICLLKAEIFIKEQLDVPCPWMLLSDKQFFKVDSILANLRALTKGLWQQSSNEFVKQSLLLAEGLANEIESLQKSLYSDRITHLLVKHSLVQLLFNIIFFKAELFLTEFLKSSDLFLAQNKHQIQSLFEVLKYFKRTVKAMLARNSSDDEIAFKQVEAVCRGITLFSYSFLPENKKFEQLIHSLPQFTDKVEVIKEKLGGEGLPKYIFPKTNPQGFIDFLVKNVRELLQHDPELIAPSENIEEVLVHLESLKSFLTEVKGLNFEMGELEDFGNYIIDIAYKLEYVVDSIECDGHFQYSLGLYDLLEDIRLVNRQAYKIHEKSSACKLQLLPQIPSQVISRDAIPDINDLPVGLDDEEKEIVERLIRGTMQRDVISIVGMPGSGKTTLAAKVYSNQNVTFHFHRRAWCTVSQTYSKRDLLLELLSHMPVTYENVSKLSDDDLMSTLRRCLLGNRYLIVMDDIWDTACWNDLVQCFPNENRQCRIFITSRSREVALKINPDSNPHSIRPFSDVESWKLLEKKIFKDAACPEELLGVGNVIAQCCQGLPLAVVAIAGLLQRIEQSKDSWEKVLGSLSSEIINDPENRCKEILELSYSHLPEHLKVCYLYLGVFLEDKDIAVKKLIYFWIAEGFVKETEEKNLEEVAEDYLMELINRSLLTIYKIRSNGKVKRCRVHDLLRDMCHLKAKEDDFLQVVTSQDKPYSSFPDSDYAMEIVHSSHMAPIAFESYRLTFNLKRRHFVDSRPSGLGARSLTFFSSFDPEPKSPYDISFICHNFKLLRVLDLEHIMASNFPQEIGLMVQLRYLAISGYMQSIPPSIANLWKLKTLVVRGSRGKIILPETVWSLRRLRHLHVNNHVGFSRNGLDGQVGGPFNWENLFSFSTPSFSSGEDTSKIFKRMPNLRNLRCIFFQSWDSIEESDGLLVLKFLTHLESLKIIYHGQALSLGAWFLPSKLKKLTLSNFHLLGSHLSMIGELPYLRVLKLVAGAFVEKTWIMNEEEFKELVYLELDSMHVINWEASYDHLPNLERLVLRNCKDLKLIPSDFACIPTLKTIEVQWCGQSLIESAEQIGDVTEEIEVLISRF